MNEKKLDLVLIHPGSRRRIYQSLGNELSAIEPPIWAGLLATFARIKGLSVKILDAEAENLDPAQVAAKVKELGPLLATVVVFGHQPSASSQNMTASGEIAKEIKKLDSGQNVLFLGGHVAALPEGTMKEEVCDYVSGGEGPYTLVELIEALKTAAKDLSKVRGLWYRENGAIKSNPVPPLVLNLDQEMPGIAWDLLPMDKYRAHNWHCFGYPSRQPYGAIYTTLGCPYHCSFCCIQAPFKEGEKSAGYKEAVNSYRFWSPQQVMKDIDLLVNKYGVTHLRLSDEMFVLNTKHVHAICDGIIERGYKLNIWAYARVDTMRGEGTIEKLKKAGVNWLCFGFESASERVRADVKKGYAQDELYPTIEKVRQAGIYIIANYIFGLPEDDLESMQMTLEEAMKFNYEFANFYSAMAYPGSQLYNLAVEQGWALPKSWTQYSQHSVDTLPLPTKYLKAAEVIRFRDNAWNAYFSNEKYLAMVEEKFGRDTAMHVREMASHKLERNILTGEHNAQHTRTH